MGAYASERLACVDYPIPYVCSFGLPVWRDRTLCLFPQGSVSREAAVRECGGGVGRRGGVLFFLGYCLYKYFLELYGSSSIWTGIVGPSCRFGNVLWGADEGVF